jgi:hypothetical protein
LEPADFSAGFSFVFNKQDKPDGHLRRRLSGGISLRDISLIFQRDCHFGVDALTKCLALLTTWDGRDSF